MLCIEGATGVFGTAAILSENHPYIALTILAIGAVAHKVIEYLETENL